METAVDERLVLVGMSLREVSARDRVLAAATDAGASVAFLQGGDPSLSRELTRLADLGAPRIVLLGVSLGTLAPAASWLRRIAAHWWRERGPGAPAVEVCTSLSDLDDLDGPRRDTNLVTGHEAGLRSAAWEQVTAHRHQVLVCRGPRCSALGSDETAEALILALMRHGLGDDDVLLTHTGCQLPCNQGPVVSVQPDDVWYGGVDREGADRIVAGHLVEGDPDEQLRLPRARSRGGAAGPEPFNEVRAGAAWPIISTMADLADIAALTWPKHTKRLTIRPVRSEDFEAIWQIRRQESVGRWMGARSEDLTAFVAFMGSEERMGRTLVIEHEGRIIGDLMLAPEDPWAQVEVADRAVGVQAEIGWCLDPAAEGNGFATEAVRELVRLSFEELGLRRLVALCFAANEPSWRLMERIGMRREAYTVKDSLHRSGEWMDGMSYGLLSEEWQAATD